MKKFLQSIGLLKKSPLAKVIEMFPRTVMVTQEIIDNSEIYDTEKCIGANTLRTALSGSGVDTEGNISWGDMQGTLTVGDKEVDIESSTNMMEIRKPQPVTLTIVNVSDV